MSESMKWARQADAIRRRRERNPQREARRQQELTRMRSRYDYVPTYADICDRHGTIVRATYIGHIAVPAR